MASIRICFGDDQRESQFQIASPRGEVTAFTGLASITAIANLTTLKASRVIIIKLLDTAAMRNVRFPLIADITRADARAASRVAEQLRLAS